MKKRNWKKKLTLPKWTKIKKVRNFKNNRFSTKSLIVEMYSKANKELMEENNDLAEEKDILRRLSLLRGINEGSLLEDLKNQENQENKVIHKHSDAKKYGGDECNKLIEKMFLEFEESKSQGKLEKNLRDWHNWQWKDFFPWLLLIIFLVFILIDLLVWKKNKRWTHSNLRLMKKKSLLENQINYFDNDIIIIGAGHTGIETIIRIIDVGHAEIENTCISYRKTKKKIPSGAVELIYESNKLFWQWYNNNWCWSCGNWSCLHIS